jgi:L-amino acid N-acyltransferase YncA
VTGPAVVLAPMTAAQWPAVHAVWAAGIATGHATFETAPPDWERFDATRLPGHRHVALDPAGELLGWVAASGVSDRCAYAGVVEHSVYVHPDATGRGVGRRLLDALVDSPETAGIWTIQSGVFPENAASLALHRAAGFRVVGVRERLGRMGAGPLAGRWRDVVLLERRSTRAGTD